MSGPYGPATVLAAALVLDLAFGDPPNRWHPVAWLGALLAAARRRLACGSRAWLFLSGAGVTFAAAALAAIAGMLVEGVGGRLGILGVVLEALALSCCLSLRGLGCAALEVARHLEAGDLASARAALAFHLVSRPTAELEAGEVAAATVESVAENLTDSVVAPALMYLVLGMPGAALYRAVNTADAMLGYRTGALEHFGKVAARADDLLNLIPSRIAAVAIVVAAALTRATPSRALAIMWRDHGRTASPNAGFTMAAMAGALGVRLVKRDAYVLGDGGLPTAADVRRSLVVMVAAAVIVILVSSLMSIKYR